MADILSGAGECHWRSLVVTVLMLIFLKSKQERSNAILIPTKIKFEIAISSFKSRILALSSAIAIAAVLMISFVASMLIWIGHGVIGNDETSAGAVLNSCLKIGETLTLASMTITSNKFQMAFQALLQSMIAAPILCHITTSKSSTIMAKNCKNWRRPGRGSGQSHRNIYMVLYCLCLPSAIAFQMVESDHSYRNGYGNDQGAGIIHGHGHNEYFSSSSYESAIIGHTSVRVYISHSYDAMINSNAVDTNTKNQENANIQPSSKWKLQVAELPRNDPSTSPLSRSSWNHRPFSYFTTETVKFDQAISQTDNTVDKKSTLSTPSGSRSRSRSMSTSTLQSVHILQIPRRQCVDSRGYAMPIRKCRQTILVSLVKVHSDYNGTYTNKGAEGANVNSNTNVSANATEAGPILEIVDRKIRDVAFDDWNPIYFHLGTDGLEHLFGSVFEAENNDGVPLEHDGSGDPDEINGTTSTDTSVSHHQSIRAVEREYQRRSAVDQVKEYESIDDGYDAFTIKMTNTWRVLKEPENQERNHQAEKQLESYNEDHRYSEAGGENETIDLQTKLIAFQFHCDQSHPAHSLDQHVYQKYQNRNQQNEDKSEFQYKGDRHSQTEGRLRHQKADLQIQLNRIQFQHRRERQNEDKFEPENEQYFQSRDERQNQPANMDSQPATALNSKLIDSSTIKYAQNSSTDASIPGAKAIDSVDGKGEFEYKDSSYMEKIILLFLFSGLVFFFRYVQHASKGHFAAEKVGEENLLAGWFSEEYAINKNKEFGNFHGGNRADNGGILNGTRSSRIVSPERHVSPEMDEVNASKDIHHQITSVANNNLLGVIVGTETKCSNGCNNEPVGHFEGTASSMEDQDISMKDPDMHHGSECLMDIGEQEYKNNGEEGNGSYEVHQDEEELLISPPNVFRTLCPPIFAPTILAEGDTQSQSSNSSGHRPYAPNIRVPVKNPFLSTLTSRTTDSFPLTSERKCYDQVHSPCTKCTKVLSQEPSSNLFFPLTQLSDPSGGPLPPSRALAATEMKSSSYSGSALSVHDRNDVEYMKNNVVEHSAAGIDIAMFDEEILSTQRISIPNDSMTGKHEIPAACRSAASSIQDQTYSQKSPIISPKRLKNTKSTKEQVSPKEGKATKEIGAPNKANAPEEEKSSKESKTLKVPKEAQTPKGKNVLKDSKATKAPKETIYPDEEEILKGPKVPRVSEETKIPYGENGTEQANAQKDTEAAKDTNAPKTPKETRNIGEKEISKGPNTPKSSEDTKISQGENTAKEANAPKEESIPKGSKALKAPKGTKAPITENPTESKVNIEDNRVSKGMKTTETPKIPFNDRDINSNGSSISCRLPIEEKSMAHKKDQGNAITTSMISNICRKVLTSVEATIKPRGEPNTDCAASNENSNSFDVDGETAMLHDSYHKDEGLLGMKGNHNVGIMSKNYQGHTVAARSKTVFSKGTILPVPSESESSLHSTEDRTNTNIVVGEYFSNLKKPKIAMEDTKGAVDRIGQGSENQCLAGIQLSSEGPDKTNTVDLPDTTEIECAFGSDGIIITKSTISTEKKELEFTEHTGEDTENGSNLFSSRSVGDNGPFEKHMKNSVDTSYSLPEDNTLHCDHILDPGYYHKKGETRHKASESKPVPRTKSCNIRRCSTLVYDFELISYTSVKGTPDSNKYQGNIRELHQDTPNTDNCMSLSPNQDSQILERDPANSSIEVSSNENSGRGLHQNLQDYKNTGNLKRAVLMNAMVKASEAINTPIKQGDLKEGEQRNEDPSANDKDSFAAIKKPPHYVPSSGLTSFSAAFQSPVWEFSASQPLSGTKRKYEDATDKTNHLCQSKTLKDHSSTNSKKKNPLSIVPQGKSNNGLVQTGASRDNRRRKRKVQDVPFTIFLSQKQDASSVLTEPYTKSKTKKCWKRQKQKEITSSLPSSA